MEKENVFEGRFIDVEIIRAFDQEREVVVSCDSAAVLVYNRRLRKVIMVQQSRLAMVSSSNREGIITEVIAGRMNKDNLTLKGLIALEIKEETDIEVSEDDIQIINCLEPLAMSPGMTTERCYLALVEIPAGSFPKTFPKSSSSDVFGVEEEGERTKRIILSFEDLNDAVVYDDMKTFGIAQYFLRYIEKVERRYVR